MADDLMDSNMNFWTRKQRDEVRNTINAMQQQYIMYNLYCPDYVSHLE
jgi:hypothetical protein